jgi:hypothetical protein
MLSKLKARLLRGQPVTEPQMQPFKEAWSGEGKMDTGFKWGEALNSTDYEFAQRRDAISWALTGRIAQTLFRNGFVVEKITRRRDLPGDIDDTRTDEINDLAEEYEIPLRGPEAVHYERTYGFALIPILREGGHAWIEPKSERMINNQTFDEIGRFEHVEIGRFHGTNWTYVWVEPPNFVHLRTRPREDLPFHQGISILETIWDPAETLRKVVWGAGQRFYRHGGFAHVKMAGSTPEQQEAAEAKYGSLTPRTLAVTNEHVDIEFPGVGGAALDPLAYVETMISMITIATGIPQDILLGHAEATVAGGAISNASYFEYLLMQQKPLLPFIKELFAKLGYTLPDDREIRFDLQYELDPKDASLVKLNTTETLNRSQPWMTVDEIRERDPTGLEELGGDLGQKIAALVPLEARPPMGNGDPNNPATTTQKPQPPQNAGSGKQAPRSPAQDAALVLGALRPAQKKGLVELVDSYRGDGTPLQQALDMLKANHGFSFSQKTYYKWKNAHG